LESFKSAGIVVSEFSRIPLLHTKKCTSQISLKGIEHLDSSSGGLIVSAHLGNWEWLAPALIQQGVPMSIVVNQFPDTTINNYIDSVRLSGGVATIPRNESAASIVQRIRGREFVGMLIDQRTHRTGVPVDFLGTKCWATEGPALIAIRARAPIHMVSMCRGRNGKYTLSVHEPILMERSGDMRRDVHALSQRLQDEISSLIRENPDQWLWGYNRWKTSRRLEREREASPKSLGD